MYFFRKTITMKKLTPSVALTLVFTTPTFASVLGPANGYNAFVFRNTSLSGSQGALAIGGNATFSSGSVAASAAASSTNLVVGGNLTAAYGTINGNAVVAGNVDYYGPSINGSITSGGDVNFHNSGGSVTSGVYSTGSYTGPFYITNTHISGPVSFPIDFAEAKSALTATADAIASLRKAAMASPRSTMALVTFTGTNA